MRKVLLSIPVVLSMAVAGAALASGAGTGCNTCGNPGPGNGQIAGGWS